MSEEIKIITLGDIFENIETEEKAFKFKDYIKDLQQKVEQLEKENKELKNDKDGWHRVAQRNYNELQDKIEQLENIRKEAIEYINNNNHIDGCLIKWEVEDLLNILNKGSDKDV